MIVRRAKAVDAPYVYELLLDLEGPSYSKTNFGSIYCDNLKNNSIHYIVCEMDSAIVGFASLHIQKLLHHLSNIAEIQELVVTGDVRGKGIGKMLFESLKSIAKEEDCTLIEVCCNRERKRSHLFYESVGMDKSHYKFTYNLEDSDN